MPKYGPKTRDDLVRQWEHCEKYTDTQCYMPSTEDIQNACAKIRLTWSDAEAKRRNLYPNLSVCYGDAIRVQKTRKRNKIIEDL